MTATLERFAIQPSASPAELTQDETAALLAALTRRQLIGGSLALGLLTACGTSAAPTPTVPVTKSIETAMGSVKVPTNPQRIVCLDSYSVSDLLDTNLTPVGIPEKMSGSVVPAHTALIPAIPTLGAYGQPDLEKLAALKPDLIMAITIDTIKGVYDKLSAIAPTTLFDYTVPDAWRTLAGQFDEAAGRTANLNTFKTTYQQRVSAVSSTYKTVLSRYKWAFVMGRGDTWQLYTPNSGGGKILADSGIQFTGAVNGLTEAAKSYSLEQINLITDADVIVTYAGRDGAPLATHAKLAELPTWQALNAVKNNRVFYMPDIITFSYNSALALIDEIEAALKQLPAS